MPPIEDDLAKGWADGRRAWAPVDLAAPRYRARAFEATARRPVRAGHAPGSVAHEVEVARAALADLYLSIACDDRAARAWDTLVARFIPPLRAVAARMGRAGPAAEEAAGDLLADLSAPAPDGSGARIATFDGRGSLLGWLTAILVRRVWKGRRRDEARATASLDAGDDAAPGALVASRRSEADDPAEGAADAEVARHLDAAFGAAWAALPPRERLALLLKHREGRTQRDIAGTLGVGEPRVSRVVAAAVDRLRAALATAVAATAVAGLPARAWDALADRVAARLARTPDEAPPSKGRARA